MDVVARDDSLEEILPRVVESGHSRYPVIGDDRAEVVGTLLAKDLLQFFGEEGKKFKLRNIIRSAVFVPESKRLDVLLREFRASRNHMAIVEDEYDFDEGAFIMRRDDNSFTAKAHTTLEDFNEYFNTAFDDESFDTIGGLVLNALGHMPKRGEKVDIEGFQFEVLGADSRKIRLLNIYRLPAVVDQMDEAS